MINAYAKSRDADAAIKAQDMLDLMEKLHEQGNEEIRPDVHSFCTVINGKWRRTESHCPFGCNGLTLHVPCFLQHGLAVSNRERPKEHTIYCER